MENLTAGKPPEIASMLEAKRGVPEDVFDHFGDGADLILNNFGDVPHLMRQSTQRSRSPRPSHRTATGTSR